MADPFTIVTSIITFIDTIHTVYGKLQDAKHLPPAFQKIHANIEVAKSTLVEIQRKYGDGSGLDDTEKRKVAAALENCQAEAKLLSEMYVEVCKEGGTGGLHRYRMYFSNMVHDRKKKVEDAWSSLLRGIQNLETYHIFKNLSTAEEIAAAIKGVQNVGDSLADSSHQKFRGTQTQQNNSTDYGPVKHDQGPKEHPLQLHMLRYPGSRSDSKPAKSAEAGTCRWVLERAEYREWLASMSSPCLAIVGHPGTGKTSLMRFLVDHVRAPGNQSREHFASFFCAAQDRTRNNDTAILRGLLYQLCDDGLFMACLRKKYDRHPEPQLGLLDNAEELWDVLQEIIGLSTGRITLLVDALDECEERSKSRFVDKIAELTSESTIARAETRIICSCRPTLALDSIAGKQVIRLGIQSEDTKNDLHIYVKSRLDRMADSKTFLGPLKDKIHATVVEQAEGIFLWASLALTQLERSGYEKEALTRLENLPSGLDNLFDDVLLRTPISSWDLNRFVLHLVAVTYRKLAVHEIAEAASLRGLEWERTGTEAVTSADRLFEHCKDLLVFHDTTNFGHGHVDFIHVSVKDYLVSNPWSDENKKLWRIWVFRTCLGAGSMLLFCLLSGYSMAKTMATVSLTLAAAFLVLVNRYRSEDVWTELLMMRQEALPYALCSVCPRLLRRTRLLLTRLTFHVNLEEAHLTAFRIAFKAIRSTKTYQTHGIESYSLVYLHDHATAATDVLQKRFPWHTDILRSGSRRRYKWLKQILRSKTTLYLVQILDAGPGADEVLNAGRKEGWRLKDALLGRAASVPNADAARLLLSRGASVDAVDWHGRSPLSWAVRAHSLEIVRLLLKSGAKPTLGLQEIRYSPTIHASGSSTSYTNHTAHGNGNMILASIQFVDPHVLPVWNSWPMRSEVDRSSIRQRILDTVLDHVSRIGEDMISADLLRTAASRHEWGVVRSLLDRGADANKVGQAGESALHLALRIPDASPVPIEFEDLMVYEQGEAFAGLIAIVSPREVEEQTPGSNGLMEFESVVLNLVDRTDDIETAFGGRTPLSLAAENGNPRIVEALIRKLGAASVDQLDSDGYSPLMRSCCYPSVTSLWNMTFNRLVVRGNGRLSCGAIYIIPEEMQEKMQDVNDQRHHVARMLIEAGANVHLTCESGQTAGSLALANNLSKTVELLRGFGAETPDDVVVDPSVDPEIAKSIRETIGDEPIHIWQFDASDRSKVCISNAGIGNQHSGSTTRDDAKVFFGSVYKSAAEHPKDPTLGRDIKAMCPRCDIECPDFRDECRVVIGVIDEDELRYHQGAPFGPGRTPACSFDRCVIRERGRWACLARVSQEWHAQQRPHLAQLRGLPQCHFTNVLVEDNGRLETCNSIAVASGESMLMVDSQHPGITYSRVMIQGDAEWRSSIFTVHNAEHTRRRVLETCLKRKISHMSEQISTPEQKLHFAQDTDEDRNYRENHVWMGNDYRGIGRGGDSG